MKFIQSKLIFTITFGCLLLVSPILGVSGPGARNSACMFSYDDNIYVLGGVMDSQDQPIFAKMSLSGLNSSSSDWSKLPDPPQWKPMTSYNTPSQFDCAVTKSGKVFLFGNQIGFAEYDIDSKSWDSSSPKFSNSSASTSPTISMKNLLNQPGLRVTTDIDQTSIIIVSTSPPVFMRLNPDTKEISGTVIYTLISGLRGYCLGVTQKNPEYVILCGGAYYNSNADCYHLNPNNQDVRTDSFSNLPVAQEGCSIDAFDAGYLINQGLTTGSSSTGWQGNNNGASSVLLYTIGGDQIKTTISTQYPLRAYSAVTYVASKKLMVVYGGVTPQQNVSSEIYTVDLTDIITNNKDGSNGSSGGGITGSLLGKILTGVVSVLLFCCVIGCVNTCCRRKKEYYVRPAGVSVQVVVTN